MIIRILVYIDQVGRHVCISHIVFSLAASEEITARLDRFSISRTNWIIGVWSVQVLYIFLDDNGEETDIRTYGELAYRSGELTARRRWPCIFHIYILHITYVYVCNMQYVCTHYHVHYQMERVACCLYKST